VSGEGGSFTRVSFHLGPDWRVYCHAYDDTTPILDICAGTASVGISVRGGAADKAAVDFARDLARQAAKFAAEVERMHAAQLADSTSDKAAHDSAA
jgi:hypothetical protein